MKMFPAIIVPSAQNRKTRNIQRGEDLEEKLIHQSLNLLKPYKVVNIFLS